MFYDLHWISSERFHCSPKGLKDEIPVWFVLVESRCCLYDFCPEIYNCEIPSYFYEEAEPIGISIGDYYKKSELGVISVKLPSNSIFFYFVVHMYSEPTGGLSPCRAYLRGIYIFVCVFISYLNYTFTLSLSLVLRIMLAARILVFDIQ